MGAGSDFRSGAVLASTPDIKICLCVSTAGEQELTATSRAGCALLLNARDICILSQPTRLVVSLAEVSAVESGHDQQSQ